MSSALQTLRRFPYGGWCAPRLDHRGRRFGVAAILALHAGLLAYSATRHSPTLLEPAQLAAGISNWEFGRFELFRVNPPLVRMVAALPVLAVGCETNWSAFNDGPGSRAEFSVGRDFIRVNGERSIRLIVFARWACIPFSLIGAYFAYRWARDLYGDLAGAVTLVLWCFEPNLLAHGELITTDCACTSFGVAAGYCFWRWLKSPTWADAAIAGLFLGLAELSKMSWLLLYGLWPAIWLVWRVCDGRHSRDCANVAGTPASGVPIGSMNSAATDSPGAMRPPCAGGNPAAFRVQALQLAGAFLVSLYVIHLGYAFDGTCTPLKNFKFVSRFLSGRGETEPPGNRFADAWWSKLPVPLPKDYVLGFDTQKRDFEGFSQASYLCGEWKDHGGWWYYYLYGLLVKVPCGTWFLLAGVVVWRLLGRPPANFARDEFVLLAPAAALLTLVSSQTEFNVHLRYAFPSLGLVLVFLGQAAFGLTSHRRLVGLAATICIGYAIVSALSVYPHHLAYFNDFVGGPRQGWRHLLGSSFDWGQDLLNLRREIARRNISCRVVLPLHLQYDPADLGIAVAHRAAASDEKTLWYAVSREYLVEANRPKSAQPIVRLDRLRQPGDALPFPTFSLYKVLNDAPTHSD